MKHFLIAGILTLASSTLVHAQAPPAQPPAAPPAAPQTPAAPPKSAPRPSATASSLAVQVTDKSGSGLGEIAVTVTGPVDRAGTTAADGTISFRSMRAGTYRLRFEHERFITLERELMIRGQAADVAVALNPAPLKTAPPPPPPQPAPAPVARPTRAVEPRSLSIPDFLDKNLIGSEPQKTTILACTDGGTARLLQVKDPMNNQQNAESDQLLYVVAGAGNVRVRDQDNKAGPGWFTLIPRGVTHSIRRDGRNPMIALTVQLGTACVESGPTR